MDCVYTGTINGKKVTFNSIKELDAFLTQHIDEIKVTMSDYTLSSVNPVEITRMKIEEITKKVSDFSVEYVQINEDGDTEIITKIPNSMGVTRVLQQMGDPSDIRTPLITPFNKQAYFDKIRENLRESMTDAEINEHINVLENN